MTVGQNLYLLWTMKILYDHNTINILLYFSHYTDLATNTTS